VSDPRTAAGQALVHDFIPLWTGDGYRSGYAGISVDDLERGILAIEAQAREQERERIRAGHDPIITGSWDKTPNEWMTCSCGWNKEGESVSDSWWPHILDEEAES
jgi:hypothetical protein